MAGTIDSRLAELGIELPEAAAPVANYVGYVVSGNHVYISGQVTIEAGQFKHIGKLGQDIDVEEGARAARLCAINILAQLKAACGGDLDRVVRCVKLGGFVNATPEFTQPPQVLNGASDLLVEIFGEVGRHARFAIGTATLPSGAAVEVDGIFEID